jgi:acyl-coenzyme A thioesterase PaaI-like protein
MGLDVNNLRQLIEGAIPYAKKTGVSLVDADEGGVARLALHPDPTNLNHVGTYHAGAIFTFGETAAGAAVVLAFDISKYRLLAKGASIEYKRRITDTLTCELSVSKETVEEAKRVAAAEGRAAFPVSMEMVDKEGEIAALMTVDYHIKQLR